MLGKLSILGAVAVLALGLVAVASVSHAQYPPPGAGVIHEVSDSSVPVGSTITHTCTVLEDDGSPSANATCTFTIISEPGTDAALGSKTVTKVANAQGVASTDHFVGTTPGIIIVEARSGSDVAEVVIEVIGDGDDDGNGNGTAPSPPRAPIEGITPPSTGSGGLAD